MQSITWLNNKLVQFLGVDQSALVRVLITISIIVVFFLIRIIFLHIAFKKTSDTKKFHTLKQITGYLILVLFIFLFIQIWTEGFHQIATFIGLLSAGIAIALKDIIANVTGWFYILINKPFEVGDRIQIDKNAGDVIEIQPLYFIIIEVGNWVDSDQSTGRIITIPNGLLFTKPLANYTKAFAYIWNEICVLITFESDWEKAKQILNDIIIKNNEYFASDARKKIRDASKKLMIIYRQLTPIVYTSVKENGVMLTIRYLCEPRKRRNTEMIVWEEILKAFNAHPNIQFAYNTLRVYKNKE